MTARDSSHRKGRAQAGAPSLEALALMGRMRAENATTRMISAAIGAVLAAWLVGPWLPLAWFALSMILLLVERRLSLAIIALCEAGEQPHLGRLALWTGVQSAVIGSIAAIVWFGEPRHGDALAMFALAASAINAVLTLRASTKLMLAGLAPTLAYVVILPLVEYYYHGARFLADIAPAFVSVLAASNIYYAWRVLREADQANVRAAAAARAAQRAAKEAASARADFVSVMAQELRTPMAALAGAAEVLRRAAMPAEARAHAEALIDSSDVLSAVLDDLVDLESIASGRVRVEPRVTDPRVLVRSVVAAFRAQAEEKSLELFLDISEATPARVRIDPVRVRQILFNLLSNAVKFTQSGGVRVRLQVAAVEGKENRVRLGFAVADTGVGMSRAELALAMGERRAATGGQKGLGLAISAKLARLMEAKLAARSAPGEGTMFSLVVEAEVVQEAAALPAPRPAGPAILVIEDHAADRRAISAILEATAAKCAFAESAARALELISQQRFDLIIADQRVDHLDAFDVAALIKQNGPNAATPIIALTETCDDDMRVACDEYGVDGYLTLPLTAAVLLEEIARVMGAAPPAASWAA